MNDHDELRRLAAAADRGHREWYANHGGKPRDEQPDLDDVCADATARTILAVPALLDEIAEMDAEIERLNENRADDCCKACGSPLLLDEQAHCYVCDGCYQSIGDHSRLHELSAGNDELRRRIAALKAERAEFDKRHRLICDDYRAEIERIESEVAELREKAPRDIAAVIDAQDKELYEMWRKVVDERDRLRRELDGWRER